MRKLIKLAQIIESIRFGIQSEVNSINKEVKKKTWFTINSLIHDSNIYNERVLQYLTYKILLRVYHHQILLDKKIFKHKKRKLIDLQLVSSDKTPLCLIEFKRWYSSGGKTEIPRFKRDLQFLRRKDLDLNKSNNLRKFFIVFTIHDLEGRKNNLAYLNSKLKIERCYKSKFNLPGVLFGTDKNLCFEIIGYEIL